MASSSSTSTTTTTTATAATAAVAVTSSSDPSKTPLNHQSILQIFLNQEIVKQHLQTLIEGSSWVYGIFWLLSHDVSNGDALLRWGTGLLNNALYYKFEEDELKKKKSTTPSALAEQERRKIFLREKSSISTVSDDDDDDDDDEVTDTEWFYLDSIFRVFINGGGLPGQVLFTSTPVWLTGNEGMLNSSCERVRQAQRLGFQTMVCIPLPDGAVVELGSTKLIRECPDLIERVRKLFSSSSWFWIVEINDEVHSDLEEAESVAAEVRNLRMVEFNEDMTE